MKSLKGNKGVNIYYIGLNNDFLEIAPKAQGKKQINLTT